MTWCRCWKMPGAMCRTVSGKRWWRVTWPGSPALDRKAFETSLAILAALRHTRVLAIFERLSRHEKKHDYKKLHSPRVERLLQRALRHPMLAGVKRWMERHAR